MNQTTNTENKTSNLTTSPIDGLVINYNNNMRFQNIIVPNAIISGECKLYKDNIHVANITFMTPLISA